MVSVGGVLVVKVGLNFDNFVVVVDCVFYVVKEEGCNWVVMFSFFMCFLKVLE